MKSPSKSLLVLPLFQIDGLSNHPYNTNNSYEYPLHPDNQNHPPRESFTSNVLARVVGVPVSRHLGGQLAMMLVATISDIILFCFFHCFFLIFSLLSTFLIEGLLESKNLFFKS